MDHQEYDVVIVGARVAGSVLAARLGDGGMRVLLVDKASFPSPTLSTHFTRGKNMVDVLGKLGILEEVLSFGSPPLEYVYWYENNQAEPEQSKPEDDFGEAGYNLSVRRETLDAILVRRACRNQNVTFMENTVVSELGWENGQIYGVKLMAGREERWVRTRFVVGADGRNSRIAKWVHPIYEAYEPGVRGIFYCYVAGFSGPNGEPDGMEFSRWGDEGAYVFPSDQGITCLAVSLNIEQFTWMRKDLEVRFWERYNQYASYKPRLAAVHSESPRILGCGPEPNYIRFPYGSNWALVGDAGFHQDPWSGWGMDNASTHAMFLADSLQDWHAGCCRLETALQEYHFKRNEKSLAIYQDTVRISKDLNLLADG